MRPSAPLLWSRRALLGAGLAVGAAGLPRLVRASGGSERRFIFVFARGGWDTTRVFSPMMHAPRVVTEPDAVAVVQGDLTWVDHPDRPAVRRFFENLGDRTAVIDGLLVRSVNHAICERLIQTGSSRVDAPDWPSILGAAAAGEHALPNLVLDGPSNPGPLHRTTSIVGRTGQLQGLLDGSAYRRGDDDVLRLYDGAQSRIDALVRSGAEARLAAETDAGWRRILEAEVDALSRAEQLIVDASTVSFAADNFATEVDTAVDLLAAGIARCVCITEGTFDTHGDDAEQGPMVERLFIGLLRLMERLTLTPGRTAATMAEETVVVVMSEMGRTPYFNVSGGKDHWPYTATMLLGPGVRGGIRVGGYDDFLSGRPVDLASGEVTDAGTVVTPRHLGATLLTLGGLDPGAWVAEPPIGAVLV
jgi:uncharacterized protein (DUF1501 family)